MLDIGEIKGVPVSYNAGQQVTCCGSESQDQGWGYLLDGRLFPVAELQSYPSLEMLVRVRWYLVYEPKWWVLDYFDRDWMGGPT